RVFYLVAAGMDLVFVACLMHLTGGAESPFFRALYVWVAMLAFFFGRRGGNFSSGIALTVFLMFQVMSGVPSDLWLFLVHGGGILIHGPIIGALTDRERERAEELRRARDSLAEANRRLLEEQQKLVQAEKLSSIGLLASGVAHEINNPLSGVMGCVKALRDETVPAHRREEYFDTVRDGLERIGNTVKGLLDFARQRSAQTERLRLEEVVTPSLRLVDPLVRKKDIRLQDRVASTSLEVNADRSQLIQALVNVLLNAVQAVPPHGDIAIFAREEAGRVGLFVEDRGAGIPRAILGRVVEPFFSTKPEGEGTGLGLAVTLGIVRAHGGELSIESEEGQGTTVGIWLPAADKAVASNA
ncbi:MAG: sensor histidine kinase, partial [Myxococcales bacterium]